MLCYWGWQWFGISEEVIETYEVRVEPELLF